MNKKHVSSVVAQMLKNGHRRSLQMYCCGVCKKQFQGGRRIDSTALWQSYLTGKRTIKELSVMHKCSERTIRRKLTLVADSFTPSYPKEATIIIDTTYFSRTFGVMLFQDATSGKILYRKIESLVIGILCTIFFSIISQLPIKEKYDVTDIKLLY